MTHPELEILAEMVARPEQAPADDVLAHVSACNECRRQLAHLSRLQWRIQQGVAHTPVDESRARGIADYVDGRLAGDARQAMAQRLREDKTALKAALHYAAGRECFARASAPAPGGDAPPRSTHSTPWWRRAIDRLWQPSPVWSTIAVATAAVAVITVALRPVMMPEAYTGVALAPYQDSARIEFFARRQAPGIGFFAGARDGEPQPFRGVRLRYDAGGRLVMSWPAVAQAENYRIAIFEVSGDTRIPLAQGETTEPAATLSLGADDLQTGKRYIWELRGVTAAHREFEARGGFVPVTVND